MNFLFSDDIFFLLVKIILTVCFTLGMMFSLTDFKYSCKKIILILSFYLIWICISSFVLLRIGGFLLILRLCFITISFPVFFILCIIAKGCLMKAIFNYTSQITVSLFCALTITIINRAVEGSKSTDLLLRALFYGIIIIFECCFLRTRFMNLTSIIQKGWGALSAIPIAFTLLILLIGTYPVHYLEDPVKILYLYACALVMFAVYFAIFHNFYTQHQMQLLSRDKELLKIQVSALTTRINDIKDAENKMRIERHDMHHKLQTLNELILNSSYDAALTLIGSSDSKLLSLRSVHYCSNPVLDALLSSYFKQAKQAGITVETSLAIPDELPVDAVALSTVFANALENAIEACFHLPEGQRHITCKCVATPHLAFEIANTCDGDIILDRKGLPVSRKEGYGIGTRSIDAFVKTYDCLCVYRVTNGWFRIQIVL